MRPSRIFRLSSYSLLVLSSFAAAETTPAPNGGVEEIIVTARRREESLQDVPVTVNAVTAETVQKLNLLQFEDIQAVVPGLTLSASGVLSRAALRGVTFQPETRTTGTVEFYLNEALVESNFLFKALFDVGQIEVLRGPQGTLRGRSAPSGAITVTTRAPDLNEWGGYVSASGSTLDAVNTQGALNIPLVDDKLAIRIAAVYDNNELDGVKSVNSDRDPEQDTKGVRASVRFQPVDSLDLSLMYQYVDEELTYFYGVTGPGAPATATHAAGYNGPVLASRDRRGITDEPNHVHQKQSAAVANINWDIGNQRLSYVGSYSKKDTKDFIVSDLGNLLPGAEIINTRPNTPKQRTHELRLSSTERIAGLFDYTIGAFYSKNTIDTTLTQPGSFLPGSFGSPRNALPDPFAFDPRYSLRLLQTLGQEIKETSIFASVTWHLTEDTELTVGGRRINFKDDSIISVDTSAAFTAVALPGCPPGIGSTYPLTCDIPIAAAHARTIDDPADKSKPTVFNASLSHHFNEDFMVYGGVGSAWRHGIDTSIEVNNATNNAVLADIVNIKNEKSLSYEVGFKSTFLDKRARVNLSVFHQTFDNMIIRTQPAPYLSNNGLSPPSVVTRAFTANADAVVDGIDLDVAFQITPRWSVGAAFSYADGKIDDDFVPCRDSNFDGSPDEGPLTVGSFPAGTVIALCKSDDSVSTNPKWNATLQSEFSVPVNAQLEGYVRGLLTYYPKNKRQSIDFTVDDYGLLDLFVGARDPRGVWDVSLYAKNALKTSQTLSRNFDEEQSPGQVIAAFGSSGYFRTTYTPRREFGATIRYAFGSR